jgi:hypothetical protein
VGKSSVVLRYQIAFAALEDLHTEVEVKSAWETIKENITISAEECLSYYELKNILHGLTKDAQNY